MSLCRFFVLFWNRSQWTKVFGWNKWQVINWKIMMRMMTTVYTVHKLELWRMWPVAGEDLYLMLRSRLECVLTRNDSSTKDNVHSTVSSSNFIHFEKLVGVHWRAARGSTGIIGTRSEDDIFMQTRKYLCNTVLCCYINLDMDLILPRRTPNQKPWLWPLLMC